MIQPDSLQSVSSSESLLEFLHDELSWPVRSSNQLYDFDADELGLDEKAAGKVGRVKQIASFEKGQPWGIFLIEFDGSKIHRSALRQVLRGLSVSRKNRDAGIPAWQAPHLIFICTSDYDTFTFAHYSGGSHTSAKLSMFGWRRGDASVRTLCEHNLPALKYPSTSTDAEAWITKWESAWDVEAATHRFYKDFKEVFDQAESQISGVAGSTEEKRLFTQGFFNRMLFIHFLSKKGWLRFDGNTDYLQALWQGRNKQENFYQHHLLPLFFTALCHPQARSLVTVSPSIYKRIGDVPYLNGGLFEPSPLDAKSEVVSDSVVAEIVALFSRYNFTVEESTPLDVQVAVDPEMLGKVFEELVNGRHDSGSYYTPRGIVSFMCRESIKGYLGGYEALVDLRDASGISVPQAKELLSKIADIKVLDPACGSGAYLLGMMQELNELTALLDTQAGQKSLRDAYKRKLHIVQSNIYGVDLDPFAVNIARLRLWLSLAVDFKGDDPEPLPNLDFKLECGDSLAAPSPQGGVQPDMFRQQQIMEMEKLKVEYACPYSLVDKDELRTQIVSEKQAIAEWVHNGKSVTGFDWRVEFAEVFQGSNPGFDVLIANPPYGATVDDAMRDRYFDRKTEGAQSKDTYGLFMARGLDLLKTGGYFSYIVSDTWRTIRTHKPLRSRLLERTSVQHVLDLPSWIFDATVNTCIVSLVKENPASTHELIAGDLRAIDRGNWYSLDQNLNNVSEHGADVQTAEYARYTVQQSCISTYENSSFFIASPKLYRLMCAQGSTRLGEIAEVKQGMATTDNEYYIRKKEGFRGTYAVIDQHLVLHTDEIASLSLAEKSDGVEPSDYGGRHYVPYDKGGESDADGGWMPNYFVPTAYYINWSKEAVHRLHTATIADVKLRKGLNGKIKPSDYTARAAVIRNPAFYFRTGITFSDTGYYAPTFRIGSAAVFDVMGMTIFSAKLSPEILMGLLASRLVRYLIKNFINHTVHTQVEGLKPIPIPSLSTVDSDELKALVTSVITKQRTYPKYPYHLHEQREIDRIVYRCYGLSNNDIQEVETWYARRYPRLAKAQQGT